jgi:hypothetical protein
MSENEVLAAFTLAKGTQAFWDALNAVIQSEHNNALANLLEITSTGETRAHYAGQVAALIDLRAVINDYAERAGAEVKFNP